MQHRPKKIVKYMEVMEFKNQDKIKTINFLKQIHYLNYKLMQINQKIIKR